MDEQNANLLEDMYRDLEEKILAHNPAADMARVRAAYQIAEEAHHAQKRRDGSPYVTHPIAAAEIVAELGLDVDSIVAALLHDCIEDTGMTHADIAKKFGVSVADIVEGVTKLTRVQYTSKEEEQMENLRKMLMAMAKDIRVILIKIADRLHNMRTMAYQSTEKQRIKSLETMEIYVPIAHRLGMQKIKWELEDISLLYLDPVGYGEITAELEERRAKLEDFIVGLEEKIRVRLDEWGINASISSRIKHIYSIYRKMYSQKKNLQEIFDLCAVRVIVGSISDCYNVLGQIHDMFHPIPGRFKDYIGTPKPNLYQSIHTTVIGTEGIPFEVQIRTWEMHKVSEYGVAAHWKYKTGDSGVKAGEESKFAWVRRLLESQQDSDAQDFFHSLKIDMFADEVFVFTPQGDVINLPARATPIDFAYAIHSEVGNRMTGARVNGRMVPIGHVLQNGDIVEIITSRTSSAPSRDWLKIAKSGQARAKIKQWFKREKREENIVHGRELFEAELRRSGFSISDVTDANLLPKILKKVGVTSLDDVFASIGYGGMTATRTVNRIRDEIVRSQKSEAKIALETITEQLEKNQQKQEQLQKAVQGVLVDGLGGCSVKFSRCCTPVPGDAIIGFVTRGYGVSIHRKDCPNYLSGRNKAEDEGRWVTVAWANQDSDSYSTTLLIVARERGGLIMDIAIVLHALSARVFSLSARDIDGGKSVASVTLEVKNLTELRSIIQKLSDISGVTDVGRA